VGAWHHGDLLIVGRQTQLPPRCVKCNGPTEQAPKRFRLAWRSPFLYLVLPGGVLARALTPFVPWNPYIVLSLLPATIVVLHLIFRKRMTVHVGICDYHRFHRRLGIAIGAFGTLLGLGLIIAGIATETGLPAVLGLLIAPAVLLYGRSKTRIVWPAHIDKHYAQLRGACPEYLAALPEFAC
jgi:hypothetical protein